MSPPPAVDHDHPTPSRREALHAVLEQARRVEEVADRCLERLTDEHIDAARREGEH